MQEADLPCNHTSCIRICLKKSYNLQDWTTWIHTKLACIKPFWEMVCYSKPHKKEAANLTPSWPVDLEGMQRWWQRGFLSYVARSESNTQLKSRNSPSSRSVPWRRCHALTCMIVCLLYRCAGGPLNPWRCQGKWKTHLLALLSRNYLRSTDPCQRLTRSTRLPMQRLGFQLRNIPKFAEICLVISDLPAASESCLTPLSDSSTGSATLTTKAHTCNFLRTKQTLQSFDSNSFTQTTRQPVQSAK